jgi:uroporphyrinogen decarboxylase
MIEGGSSKTFSKAKKLVYQEPAVAHELLGKLADTVTDYLNAQSIPGAEPSRPRPIGNFRWLTWNAL